MLVRCKCRCGGKNAADYPGWQHVGVAAFLPPKLRMVTCRSDGIPAAGTGCRAMKRADKSLSPRACNLERKEGTF